MPKLMDLTGNSYGDWTVVSFDGRRNKHSFWNCKCKCGTLRAVCANSLRTGHTKSCGCSHNQRYEVGIGAIPRHGDSAISINGRGLNRVSAEYKAWIQMKYRCFNPKGKRYKYYGGRGITVCERWKLYENFLADMGRKPTNKHSLDRIDNDGNYEPDNCRWATQKQQANNQRRPYCKSWKASA